MSRVYNECSLFSLRLPTLWLWPFILHCCFCRSMLFFLSFFFSLVYFLFFAPIFCMVRLLYNMFIVYFYCVLCRYYGHTHVLAFNVFSMQSFANRCIVYVDSTHFYEFCWHEEWPMLRRCTFFFLSFYLCLNCRENHRSRVSNFYLVRFFAVDSFSLQLESAFDTWEEQRRTEAPPFTIVQLPTISSGLNTKHGIRLSTSHTRKCWATSYRKGWHTSQTKYENDETCSLTAQHIVCCILQY